MARTVTINFPNIGVGEIEIPGLGVFPNGTHEVSDEQEATFEALGREWPEGNVFTHSEAAPVEVDEEPEDEELEFLGDETSYGGDA